MQLTLFLNADATPFGHAVCDLLPAVGRCTGRTTHAQRQSAPAARAAQMLMQHAADIIETVAASHPAMQRHLDGKSAFVPLLELPDVLHTAACRLSAARAHGALAFDLHSGPWRIAALQALRNTPELNRLRIPDLQTALDDPDRVRVAMLASAPSLGRITQLTALQLDCATPDCLEVLLPPLSALSRLAELRVDVCDTATSKAAVVGLGKALATLSSLSSLCLGFDTVYPGLPAAVGPGLARMSRLKTLHMRTTTFTVNTARDLARHLPAVQLLDFGTAFLEADDAAHFVPARAALTSHLVVGLGTGGAAAVLQQVPTLTSAAFALNGPCSNGLLGALAAIPHLTSLRLGHSRRGETLQLSALNGDDFERFCSAMRGLHCLRLGSAGIDSARMTTLAPHIAACVQLRQLELSGCTLSGEVTATLFDFLAGLSTLTWLEVGLRGAAAAAAAGVWALTRLQHLCLRADSWGIDSAATVAGAMVRLNRLTHVCVGDGLQDEEAAAVLRGVSSARQLRSLQLVGAECGAAAAHAIGHELGSLTALEAVSMRRGRIAGDAVQALSLHLPRCLRLRSVDLSSAQLGDGDVEALAAAVVGARHLTTLNLALNRFSFAGADCLASGLASLREQLRPVWVQAYGQPARVQASGAQTLDVSVVGVSRQLIGEVASLRSNERLSFDAFRYPVISVVHGAVEAHDSDSQPDSDDDMLASEEEWPGDIDVELANHPYHDPPDWEDAYW